jgi:hypothetical protein
VGRLVGVAALLVAAILVGTLRGLLAGEALDELGTVGVAHVLDQRNAHRQTFFARRRITLQVLRIGQLLGQRSRQLAREHIGQADAALGQALAELLVQHGRKHLGLLVVERAILRVASRMLFITMFRNSASNCLAAPLMASASSAGSLAQAVQPIRIDSQTLGRIGWVDLVEHG